MGLADVQPLVAKHKPLCSCRKSDKLGFLLIFLHSYFNFKFYSTPFIITAVFLDQDAPSPSGAGKSDSRRQRVPSAARQLGCLHGLRELREVPMAEQSMCSRAQHPFIFPSPEPAGVNS